MLDKSSQFLSSEQPNEPKSSDVALNIAGVEKYAWKTCDTSRCSVKEPALLPGTYGCTREDSFVGLRQSDEQEILYEFVESLRFHSKV